MDGRVMAKIEYRINSSDFTDFLGENTKVSRRSIKNFIDHERDGKPFFFIYREDIEDDLDKANDEDFLSFWDDDCWEICSKEEAVEIKKAIYHAMEDSRLPNDFAVFMW